MTIRVFNRCLYGSRLYGVDKPDSDYDYLYIIHDEDIPKAWQANLQKQGTLIFTNEELPDFDYQIAFFRTRDFLLFFENPEQKTSICMLPLSHYKTLIKANCLWVLEILFSADQYKVYPETLQNEFVRNSARLKANFKYESEYALGKGMAFLRVHQNEYKAHKNFYFAHRFANFTKQIFEHGKIIDYQEPVELFYLKQQTGKEAILSLGIYRHTIPQLCGSLSLTNQPVRIVPDWINVQMFYIKGLSPNAVIINVPEQKSIIVNKKEIETPDGKLTKGMLVNHKITMSYFCVISIFGKTLYHVDKVHLTLANQV